MHDLALASTLINFIKQVRAYEHLDIQNIKTEIGRPSHMESVKAKSRPEKHRHRREDKDRSSTGYHRRYQSRSRSPPLRQHSHHKTHRRDRKRSRSPHKRHSPSPKQQPRHEHSADKRNMTSLFVKSTSAQDIHSQEISSDNKEKDTPGDSPAARPPLLGDKPTTQPVGSIADSMSQEDKERLEQAISAAKDIASKQPSYLNAARPITAQQKMVQEKRKLLWAGKKNKVAQSRNQWETVSFGKDDDNSKFRRLMGIGGTDQVGSVPQPSSSNQGEGSAQTSERALNALEQQYEASRYLTHIARGAGLGYGMQALTTELPSQKDSTDKLHEAL